MTAGGLEHAAGRSVDYRGNTARLSVEGISTGHHNPLRFGEHGSQDSASFYSFQGAAGLLSGVTLVAPETVFLSADTWLGRDVVVEPSVTFLLALVPSKGPNQAHRW